MALGKDIAFGGVEEGQLFQIKQEAPFVRWKNSPVGGPVVGRMVDEDRIIEVDSAERPGNVTNVVEKDFYVAIVGDSLSDIEILTTAPSVRRTSRNRRMK